MPQASADFETGCAALAPRDRRHGADTVSYLELDRLS